MPLITCTRIEVKRDDLRSARLIETALDPDAEVAAGKTVLAIAHYALTANNITYAAFGDQMSYWAFFPAREGFGNIPVWGFADVVATGSAGLQVGERVYGYFPMATHLVVQADRIKTQRFIDASPHRRDLPAVYNAYERKAADPSFKPAMEAPEMLLKPLVITSFLIADFLADNAMFGARQVVISSASSKTSLGLALCARRLSPPGTHLVGLTSGGNTAFVATTKAYDAVVTYDAMASLDPSVPTVFVDMAGDADIIRRVHGHFGDQLVYSCRVGGTHWENLGGRMDLPGAKPVFFFAPSQVQKRLADWGPGGLEARFGAQWADLAPAVMSWLRIDRRTGPSAALAAYHETLEGRQRPDAGMVVSLSGG